MPTISSINLYGKSHERISSLISGATYTDDQIRETMRQCYAETGYILDPHGACGYRALQEGLKEGEFGVFCETAHPAKFKETVDSIIGGDVEIPERLAAFMRGQKQSVELRDNNSPLRRRGVGGEAFHLTVMWKQPCFTSYLI